MHQAAGGAPPENFLRLGFNKGNFIVFIGLMLGSWYASLNDSDPTIPIESFFSERPIIKRVVDQKVDFGEQGLTITPTNGWTYLKVSGKTTNRSLNFVNEQQNLVVAIKSVHFQEWPPTFYKTVSGDDDAATNTKRVEQELVTKEIEAIQYKSVLVEWFSLQNLPYATIQDGRINTDYQEFMIRVMSPQRYTDQQIQAVTTLCDQITKPAGGA